MTFIKNFFLTVVLLMALLLGFIYAIDPYDKYGINVFGFETKAVAMARDNKFNMVEYTKKNYEAFILGSSAAHRVHTQDVKEFTGLETFNYALQHTTPEDYVAITRHIFKKAKPKLILLQMDFYGLNKNFKTDTRFFTSPLKNFLESSEGKPEIAWYDTDYFTLGAISDSFKVVWVNAFGKVRHLYIEDGNYQKEKRIEGEVAITQFSYDSYEIDPKRVELLRQIKELCDRNGTKLIVWTAPYSWGHINKILKDEKLKKSLTDYKETLTSVFGELYDFNNESMEDFNTTDYFSDSSHPTQLFFQLLLTKIFRPETSVPTGFGALMRSK